MVCESLPMLFLSAKCRKKPTEDPNGERSNVDKQQAEDPNGERCYVDKHQAADQRDWNLYLSQIECALRISVDAATGVINYFALFGQQMLTSGGDYKLTRRPSVLEDSEVEILREHIRIMKDSIKHNIHKAYERISQLYNKGTHDVTFKPCQEVYKRKFILSDIGKNISAKFYRKFKCCVVRALGKNMYVLETLQGKPVGMFHVKGLKQ